MSRATAADRVRRVLAVVPWIVSNPGHHVSEVAARFGTDEETLLADLGVVYMVGLPPYSPDALVDVEIDDEGRVTIRLADFFSRPLRLTAGQGLALLASSDGLLNVPGTDPAGPLARALQKLEAALGVRGDESLDVHLGAADESELDRLRSAATAGSEVELRYYSYGRDETSTRQVVPWRVFADSGHWYLHAWCMKADGERIFRVDRIESVVDVAVASTSIDHRLPTSDRAFVFHPREGDPTIRLSLAPAASWVLETYPCFDVERSDNGNTTARFVVSATPWLERLLLRLGPAVKVVDSTGLEDAQELASQAAQRVLTRYSGSGPLHP